MRILVIGATGTIGRAIAEVFGEHEVLRASRHGPLKVDLEDQDSIPALFDEAGPIDALVCAAGRVRPGTIEQLSTADFALSVRSKVTGQVALVRYGLAYLRDQGSFTLTSGGMSSRPSGSEKGAPSTSVEAAVSAAVEAFVRAAASELPRGLRLNCVRPSPVAETLALAGREAANAISAAELAKVYVAATTGSGTGEVLVPDGVL